MTEINKISFNGKPAQSTQIQQSCANKALFEFEAEPYGDSFQAPQNNSRQNEKPKLNRQGYPAEDENLKLDRNYTVNGKTCPRYEYTLPFDMKAGKIRVNFNLEDGSLKRIKENNINFGDDTDLKAGTTIYFYRDNVKRQYEIQWDENGNPIPDGDVLTAEKCGLLRPKLTYKYKADGRESYSQIRDKFNLKTGALSKNPNNLGVDDDVFPEKDRIVYFYAKDIKH